MDEIKHIVEEYLTESSRYSKTNNISYFHGNDFEEYIDLFNTYIEELSKEEIQSIFTYIVERIVKEIHGKTDKNINILFRYLIILLEKIPESERGELKSVIINVINAGLLIPSYIPTNDFAEFVYEVFPIIKKEMDMMPVQLWAAENGYINIIKKHDGYICFAPSIIRKALQAGQVELVQYFLEKQCDPTGMMSMINEIGINERTKTLIPILIKAGGKYRPFLKKIRTTLSNKNARPRNLESVMMSNVISIKLKAIVGNSPPDELPVNAFLVSGHGSDTIMRVEDRFTLPPGVWVVTFETCGRMVGPSDSLLRMFRDMAPFEDTGVSPLLQPDNPRAREYLHKTFRLPEYRVHGPGSKCPHMYASFPAGWFTSTGYKVMRSGTMKYPLPPADPSNPDEITIPTHDITEANINDKITKFQTTIGDTFEYSIFPTKDESLAIYRSELDSAASKGLPSTKTFLEHDIQDSLSKHMRYFIGDIIARGGKGVYYFHTCRSVSGHQPQSLMKLIRAHSNAEVRSLPVEAAGGAGAGKPRRTRRRRRSRRLRK